MLFNEFVERTLQDLSMLDLSRRILITIDGPCASGKTTLALEMAGRIQAAVIHTDDFVIPHEQKTKERLSVPGGNCDIDRLMTEVILPWVTGEPVRYRRYDCRKGRFLHEESLPNTSVLILEGCYSNLPEISRLADRRVFLNPPEEIRMERLCHRESAESLKRFVELWIPLENAYFSAFGLPDEKCAVWNED